MNWKALFKVGWLLVLAFTMFKLLWSIIFSILVAFVFLRNEPFYIVPHVIAMILSSVICLWYSKELLFGYLKTTVQSKNIELSFLLAFLVMAVVVEFYLLNDLFSAKQLLNIIPVMVVSISFIGLISNRLKLNRSL